MKFLRFIVFCGILRSVLRAKFNIEDLSCMALLFTVNIRYTVGLIER